MGRGLASRYSMQMSKALFVFACLVVFVLVDARVSALVDSSVYTTPINPSKLVPPQLEFYGEETYLPKSGEYELFNSFNAEETLFNTKKGRSWSSMYLPHGVGVVNTCNRLFINQEKDKLTDDFTNGKHKHLIVFVPDTVRMREQSDQEAFETALWSTITSGVYKVEDSVTFAFGPLYSSKSDNTREYYTGSNSVPAFFTVSAYSVCIGMAQPNSMSNIVNSYFPDKYYSKSDNISYYGDDTSYIQVNFIIEALAALISSSISSYIKNPSTYAYVKRLMAIDSLGSFDISDVQLPISNSLPRETSEQIALEPSPVVHMLFLIDALSMGISASKLDYNFNKRGYNINLEPAASTAGYKYDPTLITLCPPVSDKLLDLFKMRVRTFEKRYVDDLTSYRCMTYKGVAGILSKLIAIVNPSKIIVFNYERELGVDRHYTSSYNASENIFGQVTLFPKPGSSHIDLNRLAEEGKAAFSSVKYCASMPGVLRNHQISASKDPVPSPLILHSGSGGINHKYSPNIYHDKISSYLQESFEKNSGIGREGCNSLVEVPNISYYPDFYTSDDFHLVRDNDRISIVDTGMYRWHSGVLGHIVRRASQPPCVFDNMSIESIIHFVASTEKDLPGQEEEEEVLKSIVTWRIDNPKLCALYNKGVPCIVPKGYTLDRKIPHTFSDFQRWSPALSGQVDINLRKDISQSQEYYKDSEHSTQTNSPSLSSKLILPNGNSSDQDKSELGGINGIYLISASSVPVAALIVFVAMYKSRRVGRPKDDISNSESIDSIEMLPFDQAKIDEAFLSKSAIYSNDLFNNCARSA